MKASTLFAVIIAILLGLGVVAAARYTGLFARATPPPPKQEEPHKVLVAARNLFEGMVVKPDDVKVRTLEPDEVAEYQRTKEKHLPPIPEVAVLRVLARNVEAGQPMLREYLYEQALPDPLSRRLKRGMRAVNLVLPKDRAGGGLIQVGEHVDVYLTTQIARPGHWDEAVTQTACVARNVPVIVKRDMLWQAMLPVPFGQPVYYTLEVNPYRAALLEFAKVKGDLSLLTTDANPKKGGLKPAGGAPADDDSKEYADEETRVAAFNNGELAVGEGDLERIFHLAPPLQKAPPIRIERFDGVELKETKVYEVSLPPGTEDKLHRPQSVGQSSHGYRFRRVVGPTGEGSESLTQPPQVSVSPTAPEDTGGR
jgi:Flp pilus assembly protein CpaB